VAEADAALEQAVDEGHGRFGMALRPSHVVRPQRIHADQENPLRWTGIATAEGRQQTGREHARREPAEAPPRPKHTRHASRSSRPAAHALLLTSRVPLHAAGGAARSALRV
jgi:hypothetical protein